MLRTPIQSSNISSIGYDATTATLEVEFTSHEVYQYFSVPSHLYESFSALAAVNIYNGYMMDDIQSEQEIKEIEQMHYIVRTKPVKVMQFSIDVSSIPPDSTVLVEQFIRRALLRRYEVGTIEYLNERFRDMNKKGMYTIEDRKCNFDVEIGVDMLLDLERTKTTTFVLWSGDSDFADPLLKLLRAGKKVFLFATARRISRELNALRHDGLIIFDIQKIRGFICWKREMQSKGDPGKGAPKL